MKLYTSESQTAKLIELGFEKPRTKLPFEVANDELGYAYSIGELIEMLPEVLAPSNDPDLEMPLNISTDSLVWTVEYDGAYETASVELIDALCDMVVRFNEGGVI